VQIKFIFLITLLLASFAFAQGMEASGDVSVQYVQGGLELERILQIKPATTVYAATGAMVQAYESHITIIVKNVAQDAKKNLILEEDLSYLPPNARITYVISPDISDGRGAKWNIDSLLSGKSFEIKFSVPAIIPAQRVKQLPAPKVYFESGGYELVVPAKVSKGDGIELEAKSAAGMPVPGALIYVTYPDGRESAVATGADGKVKILAELEGEYLFQMQSGGQGAKTIASIIEESVPVQPDIKEEAQEEAGFDFLGAIISAFAFAIGAIVIIAILYSIYKYLTAPVEDEEGSPLPPAPATKMPTHEVDGERMQMAQEDAKMLGRQADYEYAQKKERYPKPPQEPSESEIEEGTRELLLKRRGNKIYPEEAQGEQTIIYEPPHSAFEQSTVDKEEEYSSQEESVAQMQDGRQEMRIDDSQEEPQMHIDDEARAEAAEEEMDEAPAPKMQEDMESATQDDYSAQDDDASFKEEDIDDEAIQKTIAELEQLRAQLKTGMKEEKFPQEEVSESDIEQLVEETEDEMQIIRPIAKKAPAKIAKKEKASKIVKKAKAAKKAKHSKEKKKNTEAKKGKRKKR